MGSTLTFLWCQMLNQALAAQHLSAQGSGDGWSCSVNIHESWSIPPMGGWAPGVAKELGQVFQFLSTPMMPASRSSSFCAFAHAVPLLEWPSFV